MAYNDDQYTTHFGYRDVPVTEKSNLVAGVFRSVAPKYDVMNDLMSFGLHRYWKKFTLNQAALRTGDVVLDIASGTGDLAKAFAKMVGPKGQVVMTDINEAMLQVGLERLANEGIVGNITCTQADAENLPFADNHFDCITIAFGLRNITDQSAALRSMFRVLKPGGKLLILEFSKPTTAMLNTLYDFYSLHIIPRIGEMVAHDKASYQYLVESIRKHPDQLTLKSRIEEAGFEDVAYFNLSGGIVALHQAYKY